MKTNLLVICCDDVGAEDDGKNGDFDDDGDDDDDGPRGSTHEVDGRVMTFAAATSLNPKP